MSNRTQCKFFNSPSGCFYGASCRFSHDAPIQQAFSGLSLNGSNNHYQNNGNNNSSISTTANSNSNSNNYHNHNKGNNSNGNNNVSNGYGHHQKPLCKYFPNCMYSDRCPFYHPYAQTSTSSSSSYPSYPPSTSTHGANDYYFDDSENFEDTVYYPLPRNDIAPPADGSSPFVEKISTPELLLKVLRHIDSLADVASCMATNKAMRDALKSKDAEDIVWKKIASKEMPGCEQGGEPEGGWLGFLKDFCRQSDFINDVYGAMDNSVSAEDFEDFEDDITVYQRNHQ